MRTELDKLFKHSESQHGFWLVNNKSVIAGDLMEALNKFGYTMTKELIDKIDSPFVTNLYKKIDEARK